MQTLILHLNVSRSVLHITTRSITSKELSLAELQLLSYGERPAEQSESFKEQLNNISQLLPILCTRGSNRHQIKKTFVCVQSNKTEWLKAKLVMNMFSLSYTFQILLDWATSPWATVGLRFGPVRCGGWQFACILGLPVSSQ